MEIKNDLIIFKGIKTENWYFYLKSIIMDILFITIGILFIFLGIIGCILPILPGPPIGYIGLVFLQFTDATPFSTNFMILWAIIALGVTALDYIVPIWGTKKYGGSKYGTWGSMIGLVLGLFVPPIGIIIGPFVGALVGELILGRSSNEAIRSGKGALMGFLLGTGLKLIVSSIIAFYFFKESWGLLLNFFS